MELLPEFVGTMYLPDDNIVAVYKVLNIAFIPPMMKCCCSWDGDNGEQYAFAMRFEHDRFTEKQILDNMKWLLWEKWDRKGLFIK